MKVLMNDLCLLLKQERFDDRDLVMLLTSNQREEIKIERCLKRKMQIGDDDNERYKMDEGRNEPWRPESIASVRGKR
ncbi:predicted protein [Arabidopsis lyrata subsp. lyrata]|uniref:Predicted protein n=1 Tax=Arabidopsis lyrata subsp. lyrata TaxID=81972 RepID=D7KWJ7_ARALL|nr:predicted protein [Arabidopsis lyrata subsp. lyrata]